MCVHVHVWVCMCICVCECVGVVSKLQYQLRKNGMPLLSLMQ